jgi:hypothetical protein
MSPATSKAKALITTRIGRASASAGHCEGEIMQNYPTNTSRTSAIKSARIQITHTTETGTRSKLVHSANSATIPSPTTVWSTTSPYRVYKNA